MGDYDNVVFIIPQLLFIFVSKNETAKMDNSYGIMNYIDIIMKLFVI